MKYVNKNALLLLIFYAISTRTRANQ